MNSRQKTAVVLIQLGTPDAPTPEAVRRYLKEFLSDYRVVDAPRWWWIPLLYGVILRKRPKRSAALYQKIWRKEGVSPLLHYSLQQAKGIQLRLPEGVVVKLAMRYGNPGVASVIDDLMGQGIDRLIVVPMFPQFASSTNASALDALYAALKPYRFVPALTITPPFYNDSGYINALARTVEENRPDAPDLHYLFSFHGLPQRHVDEGDPYENQCRMTGQLLAERLGLSEGQWHLSFQSRFGKEPWLTPATDTTLEQLGKDGVKHLVTLCPGFVADCLETLEEIAIGGQAIFKAAGGGEFQYIQCINDSDFWLDGLNNFILRNVTDIA
ncbi:MAG: ferrochelatase [Magnetococcales bacterium]|nr:ferrochelatase [Magnetococcales bacterium]